MQSYRRLACFTSVSVATQDRDDHIEAASADR